KKEVRDKPSYAKPKWEKPKYEKVLVELNAADSITLIKVKGIGPFFARVIIEYREKLGGFIHKEQVMEVYGMDSVKYLAIADQLLVDSIIRAKLNVNDSELKQLLRHPYINFNQAKAIVNYRKQHGKFKNVSELQNIHLLKGETYRKIAPYLTVQ
ncbi:MAG: helix-hairpin-helix domain-containing protein, partial [Flavobacteriales bacterium]|nr:helix-hairpin-helix domain-containing protein [Flavobacteriales bacterium]